MATRTICFPISGYPYCKEQPVTFTWIKGSKRQNIRAVHDAVHTNCVIKIICAVQFQSKLFPNADFGDGGRTLCISNSQYMRCHLLLTSGFF